MTLFRFFSRRYKPDEGTKHILFVLAFAPLLGRLIGLIFEGRYPHPRQAHLWPLAWVIVGLLFLVLYFLGLRPLFQRRSLVNLQSIREAFFLYAGVFVVGGTIVLGLGRTAQRYGSRPTPRSNCIPYYLAALGSGAVCAGAGWLQRSRTTSLRKKSS